jgi:hypothetical protein
MGNARGAGAPKPKAKGYQLARAAPGPGNAMGDTHEEAGSTKAAVASGSQRDDEDQ